MATITDFAYWLKDLSRHNSLYQNIFIEKFINTEETQELSIKLYTPKHLYRIAAVGLSKSNDKTYLGCILSNRAPNPGEEHIRGSDLPDGELNKETWINILQAIIFNEMDLINHEPYNPNQKITFNQVLKELNIN